MDNSGELLDNVSQKHIVIEKKAEKRESLNIGRTQGCINKGERNLEH